MQTHKAERVVGFSFEEESRKTSFMDANEGPTLVVPFEGVSISY